MINHFKAEFYKLRHSKILITILGVCAAVIMVSFALGDMTFFGAGDGTESVIGFQAKCYLSSEIPTFQTVARSSLAYTAFFWIIGILFATIFFTKEYNTGTIKLSVAYGTKRTILYYTKAITILVVSVNHEKGKKYSLLIHSPFFEFRPDKYYLLIQSDL